MRGKIAARLVLTVALGVLAGQSWSAELATGPAKGDPLKPPEAPKHAMMSAHDRVVLQSLAKKDNAKSSASKSRVASLSDAGQTGDDGKRYGVANVEFNDAASCQAFQVKGVFPITRFQKFADVFIEANDDVVNAFVKTPGLKWMDVAQTGILPPLVPVAETKEKSKAPADAIVRGGVKGVTGKGVIVALVDSGIDFHHPDFITYDKDGKPTSRILYFWDTFSDAYSGIKVGKAAPVAYPNGAPIGTVYSRDDLTADLRSSKPRIVDWDTNSHGTACAGLAAGNGNSSKGQYTGAAPEADIIAVRVGKNGEGLINDYLLGAICDWLDSVAGTRPVVMSCSFGGHNGEHDGQLVSERQLDARFANNRKSRAICIAAGNEGDLPMHAEAVFKGSENPGAISWTADGRGLLTLHVATSDANDIILIPDNKDLLALTSADVNGLTGQYTAEIDISPGKNRLAVFTKSGKNNQVDAYVSGGAFDAACLVPGKQVSTPGTTGQAITVGSYNWNDEFPLRGNPRYFPDVSRPDRPMSIGELSAYSNPGYRRADDKTVKPDIVSPGQWYAACCPLNVDAIRDTSDMYQLFNGTSAATPYTAGIVALMFEKNPNLTVGDIKNLFQQYADHDAETGKTPNTRWGYGKLNRVAVERILDKAK